MPRFLIEVPHESTKDACERAIRVFLETGSHFMTNADWGCQDNEHKAWIVVDLDSKEEARTILPPYYREEAKIIALEKYTWEDMSEGMEHHTG